MNNNFIKDHICKLLAQLRTVRIGLKEKLFVRTPSVHCTLYILVFCTTLYIIHTCILYNTVYYTYLYSVQHYTLYILVFCTTLYIIHTSVHYAGLHETLMEYYVKFLSLVISH